MIFVMLSLLRSPSYIFPHLYSLSYLSIILLYLQYFSRLILSSSVWLVLMLPCLCGIRILSVQVIKTQRKERNAPSKGLWVLA